MRPAMFENERLAAGAFGPVRLPAVHQHTAKATHYNIR